MMPFSARTFLTIGSFVALSLAGGTVGAAASGPMPARPKVELHVRSGISAAYSLDDIGVPPPNVFPSSAPVGFNNTGQIFGVALTVAKEDRRSYSRDPDCLVWTGSRFVDISPAITVSCTPYAMNATDAKTGKFSVVGQFGDIYHAPAGETQVAFAASISAAAGTYAFVPYYPYDPSGFYAINTAGTTVGFAAAYNPGNGIFIGARNDQLTFLQPACAVNQVTACLSPVQQLRRLASGEPLGTCAFGGCTIDDAATVLGFDPLTQHYAVSKIGAPASTVELPLTTYAYVVALSDGRNVLYLVPSLGPQKIVSAVYDIVTGTTTTIPTVTATACGFYYAISMNRVGEVLGFTASCAAGDFYWTWDAMHGTQELRANVPAGAKKFQAFGVNDKAQILVSFETAAAGTHWGILAPVAAATAHPAGAKDLHRVR